MPKPLMLPCLFQAKEAPLEPCKGSPKLSITTHLQCIVGETIWKLNLMVHTHSLSTWDGGGGEPSYMRACPQKSKHQ